MNVVELRGPVHTGACTRLRRREGESSGACVHVRRSAEFGPIRGLLEGVCGAFVAKVTMASKIVPKDVVGTAKSFLLKVVKPWAITGPTATSEFLESVPDAKDYRKIAPATMPVRPAIPHAEPAQVFDIKYHTRDMKRNVKTTVQEMDPVALAAELQGLPPTPGTNGTQYVMGKAYHMDDEPGEGYQK